MIVAKPSSIYDPEQWVSFDLLCDHCGETIGTEATDPGVALWRRFEPVFTRSGERKEPKPAPLHDLHTRCLEAWHAEHGGEYDCVRAGVPYRDRERRIAAARREARKYTYEHGIGRTGQIEGHRITARLKAEPDTKPADGTEKQ